jgi:hypothetical protein
MKIAKKNAEVKKRRKEEVKSALSPALLNY